MSLTPDGGTVAYYVPLVNISHNRISFVFTVRLEEVSFHPVDQVVFECSFDELMEDVWRDQLVNIRTGEVFGEWLE